MLDATVFGVQIRSEFRDRQRDYELKTLAQFDRIARHLEQ